MTSYSFVERLAELTKAGEHRTKTHTHYVAPCDVCGEWTLVATDHFTREPCLSCGAAKCKKKGACCDECHHLVGLKCRMTPRCEGRHRKIEVKETTE